MTTDRIDQPTGPAHITQAPSPSQPPTATPGPHARAPLAGTAMVVGAFCLAAGEAVHVEVEGGWSIQALLESFATYPGRWTVWASLLMLAGLLLLPGVVAWRYRVTAAGGRGRRLTTVGAVVLGASLMGLVGFAASHADGAAVVGGQLPVPPDLVTGYERMESSVGVAVTSGLTVLGFHLGVPLLLLGLARARALPWWLATVGSVAAVAAFVVGDLVWAFGVVAFAVTAAVLAYLGVRLVLPAPAVGRPREEAATS